MHKFRRRHCHDGIPCQLDGTSVCHAIDTTLKRIRNQRPSDFVLIRSLVRSFVPLKPGEDGTIAEVLDRSSYEFRAPCRVALSDESSVDVIAHELGHVCTSEEEFWQRGAPSDELASELSADQYAYRWGFGRDIAKTRKTRNWLHHGVGPGKTFAEERDGMWYRYRVTRSFHMRLVQSEDDQGNVIETAKQIEDRRRAERKKRLSDSAFLRLNARNLEWPTKRKPT